MKRSESYSSIIKAMVKVQSELQTVKKDRINPFAESSYATLDAILNELLPKLNSNGIVLTQEPIFKESETAMKIGIETTLFHESGEWISYDPFFMQLEKGSKMNMAQSAGSIITYAKRYAVSSIFGISTDEDKDGVQATPNDKKQNNYDNKKNQDSKNNDNEFFKNKKELENRIREVAKQTGSTFENIKKYVLEKSNEQMRKEFKDFNSNNLPSSMGYVKLLETKANNKPETKQGAILDGMTSQPTQTVDWGNR